MGNRNSLQIQNVPAEAAAANPSLGNGQIVLAEAVEDYFHLKIVSRLTAANYIRQNFPVEEHYFLVVCVVGRHTSAN
jgi:hypothetical protein